MIAVILLITLGASTVIGFLGWRSTTLVARRERQRAAMAEAKYRALLTEFSPLGGVQVPF